MKKLSYIFSSLALMAAMVSCQETWDDNPKLDSAPAEGGYQEFLNIPEMAEQNIVLTKDTQGGSLALTCSQPDYGFAAAANYTVQLSLSSDFTTPMVEGAPAYYSVETVYHNCAAINVNNSDLVKAMQELLVIENSDQVPTPYYTLYIRLMSEIQRQQQATGIVPNTTYYSNVVSIKGVSLDFFLATEPGQLYLIGQPEGWNISESNMIAAETGAGTGIFKGVFDIKAGEFQFRFYKELGDWESNSIGAQVDDSPVDIAFVDGAYSGICVNGKGSWQIPDWEGGKIEVTIDLNAMTIDMKMFDGNKIYIVGACQGWNIDGTSMALKETEDGSNIFTGTYNIEEGQFQFKIYTELGDWDAHAIGSQVEDANVDISIPYTGPCVDGKGNWNAPDWAGGEVTLTVDLNSYQVSFTTE